MAVDSTRWHDGAVAQSSVFGSTLLVQGAEPLLAERAVAVHASPKLAASIPMPN